MSYPSYWQSIISKFQIFRTDIKHNSFKRKPVRITIEYHHKRFGAENKRLTTLDLKAPEMENIVEALELAIKNKELELEEKTESYENREGST